MNSYTQETVDKYSGMIKSIHCKSVKDGKKILGACTMYVLGESNIAPNGRPYGVNVFDKKEAIFGYIERSKRRGIEVVFDSRIST